MVAMRVLCLFWKKKSGIAHVVQSTEMIEKNVTIAAETGTHSRRSIMRL